MRIEGVEPMVSLFVERLAEGHAHIAESIATERSLVDVRYLY